MSVCVKLVLRVVVSLKGRVNVGDQSLRGAVLFGFKVFTEMDW
jgi:hypothetical protein